MGYKEPKPVCNHSSTTHVVATEATCTEKGNIEYWKCNDCSKCFYSENCSAENLIADKSSVETAALGYEKGTSISTTESTCSEEGFEEYKCDRCKTIWTVAIDKIAHDFGSWSVTAEPSCYEEGEEERTCNNCGGVEKEPVEKLQHSFNLTSTDKAGFDADGERHYECSVAECRASNSEIIPKASDVSLSAANYTYSGKVPKPSVTVKDGNGNSLNGYYSVSYPKANKNVGRYGVTVTLKGDYSGSRTLYFNINPKGTSTKTPSKAKKAFTAK